MKEMRFGKPTRVFLFAALHIGFAGIIHLAEIQTATARCDSAFWSPEEAAAAHEERTQLKRVLVGEYARFVRLHLREPTFAQLAERIGQSEESTRDLFGPGGIFKDTSEVRSEILRKNPRAFDRVVDGQFLSAEYLNRIERVLKSASGYLITSAAPYTPIHEEAWADLKALSKAKGYPIFIRPAMNQTTGLDPKILNDPEVLILLTDVELSPELKISSLAVMTKMLNPFASLKEYGARGQSLIIASPQRRLETVPTIDNDANPHTLMTTTSITEPIYNGVHAIQNRTGELAKDRHRIGAVIVEKTLGQSTGHFPEVASAMGSGLFLTRFTEFVRGAGFIDGRNAYSATRPKRRLKTKAIAVPDIHFGDTDPLFLQTLGESIRYFDPGYILLHDFFNGHSVNHHEEGKLFSRIESLKKGRLDLRQELEKAAVHLSGLLKQTPSLRIRIVQSNHDDWVNRWLERGEFMKDTRNAEIGIELAGYKVKGKQPLVEVLRRMMTPQDFARIDFVSSGNFKELGIQVGQHGHQGLNGARGSPKAFRTASGASVTGHVHYSWIDRDTVSVGTGSLLRPGYTGTGASNWSHSIAVITDHDSSIPNQKGGVQLLIMRDGRFFADLSPKTASHGTPEETFFHPGYPKIEPPVDPSLGIAVDQWSHRLPRD